jgi:cell division septum initiation protein DivIVA
MAAEASPEGLSGPDKLPIAFRGYAQEPTDELLRRVEQSYQALVRERDELRARAEGAERRNEELERELAGHREQTRAVSDALIAAEQAKAASEREAAALKAEAEREHAEVRERADREAQAIVREAQAKADRLVQEVQRTLEERRHEAENFLDDTKERLGALVRDLLARVGSARLDAVEPEGQAPESADSQSD